MVSQTELEAAIRQKVDQITALVVSDVSGGCGQAYDVIIVSPLFEGMNTLKRHRMVNDLLKEQIAQLHAFSQKTYTPQQYETLSGTPPPKSSDAVGATAGAAAGANTTMAESNSNQATLGAGLPSSRPSTLDTSVAQRGSKVHHRTTSSNVSVPELILTPSGGDSKISSSGRASHHRQRSLTPNTHNADLSSSGLSSPSGASGVSRLHYAQITDVGFWTELRDFLERRFTQRTDDGGSSSPSASPTRPRGEAELTRVFEDFLQTQKQHLSANDIARVRDGTGMFGM